MISTAAIMFVYLLVMFFLCWSVIYSKGRIVYKCVGIAIALWFSISFFYSLPDLKGWPAEQAIPEKSRIISLTISEPDNQNPGAFYFWCDIKPDNQQQARNVFNLFKRYTYSGKMEPRAFKLPYDRELHKKLLDLQKLQKKVGGSWIEVMSNKKGNKKASKDGSLNDTSEQDPIQFELIDPLEVLKKSNGQE